VHAWQAKVLFVVSFLIGLIVWPDVNGWVDFFALCCVSFAVARLSILLMDIILL
jgi:hypothetical protein